MALKICAVLFRSDSTTDVGDFDAVESTLESLTCFAIKAVGTIEMTKKEDQDCHPVIHVDAFDDKLPNKVTTGFWISK